jgi:Family of unknown function (DUF6049)
MTTPRRRSIAALATAMLACGLALAPLAAGVGQRAHAAAKLPTADGSSSPIQVTMTSLQPLAPQPGNTVTVTGTLRNRSEQAVTELNVQLRVGGPISGRGEFDTYAADPDGTLPNDIALTPSAFGPVTPLGQSTLAPGGSEPFTVKLPLDTPDDPNLPSDEGWQVRPLGVVVTSGPTVDSTPPVVGDLKTFLPWAPPGTASNGVPTQVAWIWPLIDRPHHTASGAWADDKLAPELAPNGRLTNLLAAGTAAQDQQPVAKHSTVRDVPVTWAIDPMLVSDVKAMTSPYKVTVGSKATVGTGTPNAKTWLAGLRTAVVAPNAAVMSLPFADPDVVPAFHHGFATTIGQASTVGRTIVTQDLDVNPLPGYSWPPGGLADQHAVNGLAAAGDTPLVLSDVSLPFSPPPKVTPTARTELTTGATTVTAVLSDSFLSNDVDAGAATPSYAPVALQRFLAETLMIQVEQPAAPARAVVIAPDQRWDPSASYAKELLSDTGRVPWIQPVSLSSVASATPTPVGTPTNGASPPAGASATPSAPSSTGAVPTISTPPTPTVQRGPLTYPASGDRAQLPAGYLHRAAVVRDDIDNFNSILPADSPLTRDYATAVQEALSSAWRRPHLGVATARLAALTDLVRGQMQQVRITSKAGSYVTLTSHDGKVPITISNNLGTQVTVTVQLQSHEQLTLSNHGEKSVPIPPHQQTLVYVNAAAKTSGVFPVTVRLLAPNGNPYDADDINNNAVTTLYVRSTAYGTITLIITGGATAALMIAVAIRLVRRARTARRGAIAART